MKIFVDCSLLSIGGGIQVGLGFIHNILSDDYFKVILVASKEVDQQLSEESKSKCYFYCTVNPCTYLKKINLSREMLRIEKKYNPDLVFTVFGPSYWKPKTTFLQGFALPKMLYPEARNHYSNKLDKFKEQFVDFFKSIYLKKNSQYLLVETEVFKKRLIKKMGFNPDNVFVIRNSYSPFFQESIDRLLKTSIKDENNIKIFIPGGYYRHKNYESIPLVAKELKNKKWNKKFCFYFSIKETDPGWKNIQKIAKDIEVEEYVKTLGHIPNRDIAQHYLKSDIVISLSTAEASTAVYPEAMYAQIPLIVSDTDFARSNCENAALFVDPFNISEIADEIISLTNDQYICRELITNGISIFTKNYPSPIEKWKDQRSLLIKLFELSRNT